MIKAVIVEDEGVAARRLTKMLEAEEVTILATLSSNKTLSAYLEEGEEPDLYFMDIHLNDGIVFETLQRIEVKVPIIFTTAYDEFAIKAFKQKSVDYLLKPVDKGELRNALSKFQSIFQSEPQISVTAISEMIQAAQKQYRERIKVKIGDRFRSFRMSDISMIYSESKITFVCTEEGRSYPIDQTLESISKELDPDCFHRLNRSQIVNIDFISEVVAFSNSRLKVSVIGREKDVIIVARERVRIFKDWLG